MSTVIPVTTKNAGARARPVREMVSTVRAQGAFSSLGIARPTKYANAYNWIAHYRTTALSMAKQFPDLDVLLVGAGTTGTLMGCSRLPCGLWGGGAVACPAAGGLAGRQPSTQSADLRLTVCHFTCNSFLT